MKGKRFWVALICSMTVNVIFAGSLDDRLEKMGFVDVSTIDSTIVVDLMYARADNFVGVAMYEGLERAWLHRDTYRALKRASERLHELRPDLRFKICDASRPMSVQKRMYSVVRGTDKAPYVSNPANGGGMHNYGLAVDITLCDTEGNELDMGTKVDHLGKESNIDIENELVRKGVISADARSNRELLREVMKYGGFTPLRSEWWHFNLVSRPVAKARYKVLDF